MFLETFQNANNDSSNDFKTLICKECGKEFKIGPKGKRDVCSECYKKIINHVVEDDKKIITKVCKECGNKFQISTKGKRDLCDKCYKENLKEKDRLRKIPEEKVHQ